MGSQTDGPLIAGVPPALAGHTGFLLSKLGSAISRRFADALEPLGLTRRQFAVLATLAGAEGASQHELGGRLRIDPSSMVAVIDDCERAGLLERRRDGADRRRYSVYLTDQGCSRLERAQQAAATVQHDSLAALDRTQRAQLHGLLERLAATGPLATLGATPQPAPAGSGTE